ncbi:MAG: family 43 glycosylhydrolase [Aristaeellaceae bacterium]
MTGGMLRELLVRNDLPAIRQALPLEPTLMDWAGEDGIPLTFVAARESSPDILRYLVEYGLRVNLNAVDAHGRDMLHYAAMSGSVEKCRYLLERGGMNPLRGDNRLVTPFDIAHHGGHTELEAYFAQAVGFAWAESYHNPIRRGFYPDPSIVRVGEDYYMVNSTFIFFPCIPISHSRDLIHWEVIGHAITNPDWAHLEGLEGGRGYWAPDISYCNGRYYICATLRLNDTGAVRRRQMVVTADKPEGPYSEPVFFEEDGIDPSIFHDDDGRHYMLLNRGARIFEIDETATQRLSDTTLLYYGSHGRAPEGPHLLKHDGWYYLFEAEGGTGMGHRETVARSRTLHGVYQPSPYNPVIRQWDERALIQRCGHAKPVSTPDGRWYFVYLCGRALDGQWTLLGRETALDPFTWTEDGWPLLHGGRGISTQNRLPLPPAPVDASRVDWVSPRPPEDGQFRWHAGGVTIRGSSHPMTDTRCRSVLLQRQTAFRCRFGATLTVPEQGEAGITCYYDENSFLTLGVREGRMEVTERIGLETRRHDLSVRVQPGQQLRLDAAADGLTRVLSLDGADVMTLGNVTYLADEGVHVGKRFTGAMMGVYAIGCTADFTALHSAEEDEA